MQLICLSATVANPDELAGWINQVNELPLADVGAVIILLRTHLTMERLTLILIFSFTFSTVRFMVKPSW